MNPKDDPFETERRERERRDEEERRRRDEDERRLRDKEQHAKEPFWRMSMIGGVLPSWLLWALGALLVLMLGYFLLGKFSTEPVAALPSVDTSLPADSPANAAAPETQASDAASDVAASAAVASSIAVVSAAEPKPDLGLTTTPTAGASEAAAPEPNVTVAPTPTATASEATASSAKETTVVPPVAASAKTQTQDGNENMAFEPQTKPPTAVSAKPATLMHRPLARHLKRRQTAATAQVQLLSVDIWNGQPSVVIGTKQPADGRIRVLQPGDFEAGISLRSADVKTQQAIFLIDGKPVLLSKFE